MGLKKNNKKIKNVYYCDGVGTNLLDYWGMLNVYYVDRAAANMLD